MHDPSWSPGQYAASRGIALPLIAVLGFCLLELVVVAPAVAQQQAPTAPLISPPSMAPWTIWGKLQLTGAIFLGAFLAWMRLKMRFKEFFGLGVFRNWYSWLFLGFVAVLSFFSYSGITELESVLTNALGRSVPALMTSLSLGGGGAGGHAIIGSLGRLVGLLRPRRNPRTPGPTETSLDKTTANFILDFFYYGISVCIAKRMNPEIKGMAETYEWETIQQVCSQLLKDWMTLEMLSEREGTDLVQKVLALPTSSQANETNNKYEVLRWTIAKSSFSELRSRLLATRRM